MCFVLPQEPLIKLVVTSELVSQSGMTTYVAGQGLAQSVHFESVKEGRVEFKRRTGVLSPLLAFGRQKN